MLESFSFLKKSFSRGATEVNVCCAAASMLVIMNKWRGYHPAPTSIASFQPSYQPLPDTSVQNLGLAIVPSFLIIEGDTCDLGNGGMNPTSPVSPSLYQGGSNMLLLQYPA